MSKLYEYRQNNTFGSFIEDEQVAHYVIIEAENPEEADDIAMSKGIYFDGCDDGLDCECCGDRWHRADEFFTVTLESMKDMLKYYRTDYTFAYIYYKDGTREELTGGGESL